jgi:hypothetical protein
MAIYCRVCGFSSFRPSRIQFNMPELARLLLLRFPVRCMNCNERSITSLMRYLDVQRERKARHRRFAALHSRMAGESNSLSVLSVCLNSLWQKSDSGRSHPSGAKDSLIPLALRHD